MTQDTKLSDLLQKKNYPTKKIVTKKSTAITSDSNDYIKVVDGKIVVQNLDNFTVSKEIQYDTKINDEDVIETSRTFTKRLKNVRWNADDTALFYEALKICGTDFSLIGEIFVGKDRRVLKNKYKNELKKNAKKINTVLSGNKQYNSKEIEYLKARYIAIKR